MILLNGDDDGEVSIGATSLEVVGLYACYDSHDFFLQVLGDFLRDVAIDTGDFIFLGIDCFLDRDVRDNGIRYCDVLVLFFD